MRSLWTDTSPSFQRGLRLQEASEHVKDQKESTGSMHRSALQHRSNMLRWPILSVHASVSHSFPLVLCDTLQFPITLLVPGSPAPDLLLDCAFRNGAS